MKKEQLVISTILGAFGTWFDAYGALLGFMLVAICFDVITGIIKAGKNGELSSKKGTKGFLKKLVYFITFGFGVFLDAFIPYMLQYVSVTLPFKLPFAMIITFYIVLNECISICENIYDINPQALPGWIVNILKIGKKKIEDMGNDPEQKTE